MVAAVSAAAMAQHETGEEDGANDEDHPGDDPHPGRGTIDPCGSVPTGLHGWDGCVCGFLLECFSHDTIVSDPV